MEPCTDAIYTVVMKPSSCRPLIAVALCCTVAAWAQTAPLPPAWKWRDATGQIVVSDTPPPMSVPDKSILERPPLQRARAAANAAAAASAPPVKAVVDNTPRVDPELEARRRAAASEQVVQQKAEEQRAAAARVENCTRAKGQLAALVDGQRMVRTNEKGEREVMDDKARADETQRARAIIASDCK
jgi:hypothetical protein